MSSPVLRVIYSRGHDGYVVAECPQLPGCMSQGKTRDEASKNIADAIESVLTVRMLRYLPKADPCSNLPTHQGVTKMQVEGFALPEGVTGQFQWPSAMSEDAYKDFLYQIEGLKTRVNRAVQKDSNTTRDVPSKNES